MVIPFKNAVSTFFQLLKVKLLGSGFSLQVSKIGEAHVSAADVQIGFDVFSSLKTFSFFPKFGKTIGNNIFRFLFVLGKAVGEINQRLIMLPKEIVQGTFFRL